MTPPRAKFKTVLITGSAKRIGREIALRLSKRGYAVAIHYHRSQAQARSLAKEISQHNGRSALFRCDLNNTSEVTALIKSVCAKLCAPEVLVNNASVFEPSRLKTVKPDSLEKHMNINLKAPLLLMRDFAKICKTGQIVNILDTHIDRNRSEHLVYLLSKKALAELTKMAAVELAPGIRVNAVAPGLTLPPPGKSQDHLKRLAKHVPLKRKGNPAQIAQCVEFLLDSPYITGEIIYNDGGERLI